ncbi:MAG: thioredoxin domain-containing protein [Candidatus Omnitrophota bacterium]
MQDKLNKILILIIGLVFGISAGMFVTVKRADNIVIKEMIKQQAEGLVTLKELKQNLLFEQPGEGSAGEPSEVNFPAAVFLVQQDLQKRVTALETKLDALLGGLDQAKGLGGRLAEQGPPPEDFKKVYPLDIGRSPVRGDQGAAVTIVEFNDFQCPFSARFHPAISEILKAYPKDVKYVLKNFPLSFHPQAVPAAKAAFAAGEQGKYWEMVDLLLQDNSRLSEQRYQELAEKLELSLERFNQDLKDKDSQWTKWIEEDIALGASAEVRGTPTFYINGRKTFARTFEQFKDEIGQILKEQTK